MRCSYDIPGSRYAPAWFLHSLSGRSAAFMLLCILTAWILPGCSNFLSTPEFHVETMPVPEDAFIVPAVTSWLATGFEMKEGEILSITAGGRILAGISGREPIEVGPEGTYFFDDRAAEQQFPIPSGARGPAPCYALIGRIGDGAPFLIGRKRSFEVERDGMLHLGINDFQLADNAGQFHAKIERVHQMRPVGFEESVPDNAPDGEPVPGASVVVFYVDGLRPDVVREMTAAGHLPHIQKLFLENGIWMNNTFTAFPSDTITSNGTMWTGCFSDRHGLKGQVRFSRQRLDSESYLDPLGPNRSARLLAPQGLDKFVNQAQAKTIGMVRGEDQAEQWYDRSTTDTPPLYAHLRAHGADWATGILPIMTEVPPPLWTRSLVRYMPYLHSQEAWQYIDESNTHYAVRHLLQKEAPVTVIWLPETDSVSHKQCRGQFGMTRRTIARADRLIGRVVDELEALGRSERTYYMLVSDHGHHGGQNTHLSHFDLAHELIFKPRELSPEGDWTGGGMGLSVRMHRSWARHPGDSRRDFVFIDGDSDGAARLFLPKQHYRSGDWSGASRPADLLAYRVADGLPPLNLVDSLTNTFAVHGSGQAESPIDLVLMKLNDRSILIGTADRGYAVIDRKRNEQGHWVYRYTVARDVRPAADGGIDFTPVDFPETDPLRFVEFLRPENFRYYHDERTWLDMTSHTRYPDSVVTLTRHMLWQENIRNREAEFAPDLVVTARPGWYFGTEGSPGTMHGYPLADATRASWFISGPKIRRGARLETPCRLTDLTPTILHMVGVPVDFSQFDGRPLRQIYVADAPIQTVAHRSRAVYWQDFDLDAWQPISYRPVPRSPLKPFTINRPESPFDVNNIAYNVASISELGVFRLLDDVISPLTPGERRLTDLVEETDSRVRRMPQAWISEGAQVLDVPGMAICDYNYTSLGNLKRINGAVDWIQHRSQGAESVIASQLGTETLPGSRPVHGAIDATQVGFWEVYRFAQRVAVEVLDETLLNGLENGADRAINSLHQVPAEIVVEPNPRVDKTSDSDGTTRRR